MKLNALLFFICYMLLTPRGEASVIFKTEFKKKLPTPSIIEKCGDHLFVYSVSEMAIFKLSPLSGDIVETIKSIKGRVIPKVTALGCYKQQLVIAGSVSKKNIILFEEKEFVIPENSSFIRSIACSKKQCLFVSDKIFISSNLERYKVLHIPSSQDISKYSKEQKRSENPFDSWQDDLIINSGRYFQAEMSQGEELYLLDSLRSSIVILPKVDQIEKSIKWGKWGGWEGQLMYPKGLSLLEKQSSVVVTDVGLKLLFVFNKQGEFLGKVGPDDTNKNSRFSYPIDVASEHNMIWAIDFLDNYLVALKIIKLEKDSTTDLDVDQYLHKNLFQHGLVLKQFSLTRCMNCHDGLLRFDLDKFAGIKGHHPVNIEIKDKIDLPLKNGNTLFCSTCHNNHHKDNKGEVKISHHLRKNIPELCLTCHKEKGDQTLNHINIKRGDIKVDSCDQCHQVHATKEKMYSVTNPRLCLSCHKNSQIPRAHPFGENEKIGCLSCHTPHGTKKKEHFARHSSKIIQETCLKCHKKLKLHVGTNKHMFMKKDQMLKPSSWPGNESVCINCHNPHKKSQIKESVKDLCISCHKSKNTTHLGNNVVANTTRAKDIRLVNKSINCLSCHQHHGLSSEKKFLKNKDTLLKFCSSCHGLQSIQLFENFHKTKEGNKQ